MTWTFLWEKPAEAGAELGEDFFLFCFNDCHYSINCVGVYEHCSSISWVTCSHKVRECWCFLDMGVKQRDDEDNRECYIKKNNYTGVCCLKLFCFNEKRINLLFFSPPHCSTVFYHHRCTLSISPPCFSDWVSVHTWKDTVPEMRQELMPGYFNYDHCDGCLRSPPPLWTTAAVSTKVNLWPVLQCFLNLFEFIQAD